MMQRRGLRRRRLRRRVVSAAVRSLLTSLEVLCSLMRIMYDNMLDKSFVWSEPTERDNRRLTAY